MWNLLIFLQFSDSKGGNKDTPSKGGKRKAEKEEEEKPKKKSKK